MRHVLLFVCLCFFAQISYPAFERTNQGSRSTALGGSPVALHRNEWAASANPAALTSITQRTLSVFYTPRPFEMQELSHGAISFIEPTSFGTFALSASRFGFELYRESQLSLSFAEAVTPSVFGGVTVNYYSLSIQNYGAAASFGIDLGMLIDITDEIQWGFAAVNINAATIGEAKEKLPQIYRTGVAYSPARYGTILLSIEKDIRYAATLHLGVEYELMEMIALRAGSSTDPDVINGGVGIRYAFARLDYALSSHAVLGVTHQFSLSLNLGEL